MATSLTHEITEPDGGSLRRSSSVGKPSSSNTGQSKFLDYLRASTGSHDYEGNSRRNSRGKPTTPNNGPNISPRHTRASTGSSRDLVHIARNSTGKSTPNNGESVSPHYLRASTGSCHDFCKYGRKHEFDVKARRPIPKRVITLPSDPQNPTVFGVSAGRKTTTVVKVKPKPPPVSKTLSVDSPSSNKQEVSPPLNKIKVSSRRATSNEKEIAQDEKKKNLSAKHIPVKQKNMTLKPSSSSDASGGLDGRRSSEIKIAKKTGTPKAAVKKIVVTPASSVSPKPSNNRVVSLTVKKYRSPKLLSPLKDQNRVRKAEPKQPNTEKVPEKTLHVIKVETESEVLESTNNGITIHLPLSPAVSLSKSSYLSESPPLSTHEEEAQEESELTESQVDETDSSISMSSDPVNLHKADTSKANHKWTSGKGRAVVSDDEYSAPAKLKFRRGKVVDLQSENGGPRRLRFRQGRVLGENQGSKANVLRKRSFIKRGVEDDRNGTNLGLERNHKRTPRRAGVGLSDEKDCSPAKLKFRRGKVVDPQSENGGPRRLRFRQGRVLGESQVSKANVRNRNLKKERVENDTNGADRSSEKVVLRHQDVQGKKDAQGLFNNVIEETASKLVETRKSKVKALVGAFETVISLQESKPST